LQTTIIADIFASREEGTSMTVVAERVRLGNDRFSDAQIAATISRKVQQLIILPTEKCNFRCSYCYEDFMIGK
jgi:uncharacterized protein